MTVAPRSFLDDAIEMMRDIPDQSIDRILADLPSERPAIRGTALFQ
jgi:hypothetical protein